MRDQSINESGMNWFVHTAFGQGLVKVLAFLMLFSTGPWHELMLADPFNPQLIRTELEHKFERVLDFFIPAAHAEVMLCDVDVDGDIDRNDIDLILAQRNQSASGPDDPADADGDDTITVLDARICVLQCSLPNCAIVSPDAPPVADAGADQTATVGTIVTLDGSASSDPDGDTLSYSWSFVSVPVGSDAAFDDPTLVMPSFTLDEAGDYLVQLVVNDGTLDSAPDTVTVSTINSKPVADAGADQTAFVGDTIVLDGSGSNDIDGDTLTYNWMLQTVPVGSGAVLNDPTSVMPSFIVDVFGDYVAQLVVNDETLDSDPDMITISTLNSKPVADAGTDQAGFVGDTITLDGTGTSDVDGDLLSYSWSLVTLPTGSGATLDDPASVKPSFVIDVFGDYIAQLVVNDGALNSEPDNVNITTLNSKPIANAGADQAGFVGDTITLDGTGSSDVDGDLLSYSWSLVTLPDGSVATLNDPTSVKPSFVIDVFGDYVAQLIVNDSQLDSDPDNTTITTLNSKPLANAGVDQSGFIGDAVTLDGTGSSDVDGDPLTYQWSLTTVPVGSSAVLDDPSSATPSFLIDSFGDYIAQLIVNDGLVDSDPDTATVTTLNSKPVANAGIDQIVNKGDAVILDGSASSDADGDVLSFLWSFTSKPAGSSASLSDPMAIQPGFTADVAGLYVLQLIVNDGIENSDPDTVSVDARVLVPDVVGLSQADAEAAILATNLTVGTITTTSSDNVPADHVISQNPLSGESVVVGSAVDLEISTGPVLISVPDVVGLAQADAEAAILAAGLSVGVVTNASSDTVPVGNVISQNPSGGSNVTAGSAVDLVVSTGPDLVSVPDVVGLAQADAESAITAAGLTVGLVSTANSDTVPVGNVISQSPVAGTSITTGSAVDLVISDGPAFSVDITPPVVTITVDPPIVDPGNPVLITVQGSDNVGVVALHLEVNNVPIVLDASGQALFTPAVEGLFTAVGAAEDAEGLIDQDITVFTARSSNDNGAPTVSITSPGDDSIIESVIDIIGTAYDLDLAYYELQIAPRGSDQFTAFFQGTSSVSNDILGEFNPLRYPSGFYDFRVCGKDTWGNEACTKSMVYQISSLKERAGSVRLAFLDGNAEVAGFPLVVRRIYDSRDKNPSDFGIGWKLDTDEIKLVANRVMGKDWQQISSGGFFPTYSLLATKDHRVSVTLPNGEEHRFRMRPVPQSQPLIPIQYLTGVGFDNISGTGATLSANFGPDFVIPSGVGPTEFFDVSLDLYNPTEYILTLRDGTRLSFSNSFGSNLDYALNQIRDVNDNTVLFGPNGITHSSGVSVSFTRDSMGRIVTLTNPDGGVRTYTYDANNDLVTTTDYSGNETRYLYDDKHNLMQVIDPRGNIPGTLIYDVEGRVVGLIDVDGNRVDIKHDDINNQEIITDRFGNTTVMTYDDTGNLVMKVDALGNVSKYTYDVSGNMTSITDPLGNTQSFTYNANGDLVTYSDQVGKVTMQMYNAAGELTSITDPLGRLTSFEYDTANNQTAIVLPNGGRIEKQYDVNGNMIQYSNPVGAKMSLQRDFRGLISGYIYPTGQAGAITTRSDGQLAAEEFVANGQTVRYDYSYDANGNITNVVLPGGKSSTLLWDETGLPIQATDTKGNIQQTIFDVNGNPKSYIDYNGGKTQIERDIENRVIGLIGPGGQYTQRTLDALGRPIRVTLPTGVELSLTYDAAGHVLSQGRTGEGPITFTYDPRGLVTNASFSDGGITSYEYDAVGQVIAVVDQLGLRTEFDYDALGNISETRLPDGNKVLSEYDLAGQLTAIEDERRARFELTYNLAGQVSTATDTAGGITTYTYDDLGLLAGAQTPGGNSWQFTYDGIGNKLSTTYPWGGTESIMRDAVGLITQISDATGVKTILQYDAMGRLTGRTLEGGVPETRTYNINNDLVTVIDATGTTSYSYDDAGRVIRITESDGTYVDYGYDGSGRLLSLSTAAGTTNYSYDSEGRMTGVSDSQLGNTVYTYDLAGRLVESELPDGSITSYTRNSRGLATHVRTVTADSVTVLRDQEFSYDEAGNPIQIHEADRQVDYTYDTAGRIETEARIGPDSDTLIYAYDSDWNLHQMGARNLAYDGNMRLMNDGMFTSYVYDEAGRPITRSNKSITEKFTYDSLGRLVRLDRTGSLPAVVELTYNHASLLSQIVADGHARTLLWDVTQPIPMLLEERDDAGSLIRRYIHGVGPIGIFDGVANTLHFDETIGSVRLVTSAAGSVVSEYAYSAYGESTVGNGDYTSPLQFAGEYFVPELGLYYNQARFYDAVAGRFLTPDFLEPNEQIPATFNPYLYAGANPVRFNDPTGNFSIAQISVAVSIVNILVSIALPHFPQPVLLVAKALGLTQADKVVGASVAFAASIPRTPIAGGLQFDLLWGPTKKLLAIWAFIGGDIGTVRADPRTGKINFGFWAGAIYGNANSDPGDPRPGVYVMFSGTMARVLGNFAFNGRDANAVKVAPKWNRGGAAIQFEVVGVDRSGQAGSSFFQAFTLYGSAFNPLQSELDKIKFAARGQFKFPGTGRVKGRTAWGAGISIALLFPLIWFAWTGNGLRPEVRSYFF